ncbi:Hypothetical_protein [Hexamita inflata]|uniref:Hypothetical_protein n=1 Tax=Hexamita inflata TaxID=28002 RepID=A0AA86P2J3_9EUKA|nr:Hypothetical protein HINF_LOCUS17645 [Hexamita inflata]
MHKVARPILPQTIRNKQFRENQNKLQQISVQQKASNESFIPISTLAVVRTLKVIKQTPQNNNLQCQNLNSFLFALVLQKWTFLTLWIIYFDVIEKNMIIINNLTAQSLKQ